MKDRYNTKELLSERENSLSELRGSGTDINVNTINPKHGEAEASPIA